MGYVGAKGGFDAIRASENLADRRKLESPSSWLEIDQIIERLPHAVDRIMGEGGLWDEATAARAFRQASGDVIEAAHIVRAHRSTLPRLGYTHPVHVDEIDVLRRIVPAFREPPGPQLLGHTPDYTGRLLDQTPEDDARAAAAEAAMQASRRAAAESAEDHDEVEPRVPGRLLDVLRAMDAMVDRRRTDDPEPADITKVPARPGAPRSARLSAMARAESGALVQLWYRNILGPDRHLHEVTLGEVRHGRLPVAVTHPLTGEELSVGQIRVTEVEAIEDLDGSDEDRTRFDVGYGLCLGHNEKKAIAMANLDIAVHRDIENAGEMGASVLEQSILMTTDGLDASGFLEHLKLPHYVTFRSMMERKQAMRSDRVKHARDERKLGRSDCEFVDLSGDAGSAAPVGATQ